MIFLSKLCTLCREFHQMSDPKITPNQNTPKIEPRVKAFQSADQNKLLVFVLSAPLLHIYGSF